MSRGGVFVHHAHDGDGWIWDILASLLTNTHISPNPPNKVNNNDTGYFMLTPTVQVSRASIPCLLYFSLDFTFYFTLRTPQGMKTTQASACRYG